MSSKARYIMIGGFLGAGKTTAVARLAETLKKQGQRVGLITNDQGSQLVDTAMLSSRGFSVEEIAGGCFCCRFNSLMDAARKLSEETRPNIFIAEPVGSCTDLVATVTYPLRRIYGEQFSIAPLSVVVDPIRALRVFGLEKGGSFSEKVVYIYQKQLQEADIIVINKIDLLTADTRELLRNALASRFPAKKLIEVSARNGEGLDDWFTQMLATDQPTGPAMEVDYRIYGQGEALLGWLNATVQINGSTEFDGNALLNHMAANIQARLQSEAAEIAHLKMTLSPNDAFSDVAVINLVRNDSSPELSQELPDLMDHGELIINIRAEADPSMLRTVVEHAVSDLGSTKGGPHLTIEHIESFRPSQPEPTHRIASI